MNAVIEDERGAGKPSVFDAEKYSWTAAMLKRLKNGETLAFDSEREEVGLYRPFCAQHVYFSHELNERPGLNERLFPLVKPHECAPNVVISVVFGNRIFSALATNVMPDIQLSFNGQNFPLYWYEKDNDTIRRLPSAEGGKVVRDAWGNRFVRHDAITDKALTVFRDAYPTAYVSRPKSKGGPGIRKEDVFWYVYGILHSPEYRRRFATNLQKELPRIPLDERFERFCEAGRALGELHLRYETVEPWPNLKISGMAPGEDPGKVEKLRWGKRKNLETGKAEKDFTTLVYNKRVTISNIPERAQSYVVNGRSPLDWMIDRYQVKTDKATGIVNDPNEYSDDPHYILDLACRLVTVAVKTNEIVGNLPPLKEIAKPASWPATWEVKG